MAIQIDQARARDLSPQLDDALQIVCNEFEGLDAHRGYHNAFARVLNGDTGDNECYFATMDERRRLLARRTRAAADLPRQSERPVPRSRPTTFGRPAECTVTPSPICWHWRTSVC